MITKLITPNSSLSFSGAVQTGKVAATVKETPFLAISGVKETSSTMQ